MDWKKYSMALRPMFEALVLTAAKRNREVAIRADEMTMAHLRPTRGMAYMRVPSRTPGMPQM